MTCVSLVTGLLLLMVCQAGAQRLSDGPQTVSELLKEVKKIQGSLAGTWYFSDCEGPEAFYLPGYREAPKRFKEVKIVFSGDKVAIHHGETRDEVPVEIPLLVDARTQRIALGPPRLKFLGRRGIVRRENDWLELHIALVPEGAKPDFEFYNPDGSLRTFTETPGDFCGKYSFVLTFRRDNKERLPVVTFGGPPAPSFGWGSLAWSPDGKELAIAAGAIEIRDRATGELRRFLSPGSAVSHVAYSPDGKWLACDDGEGTLRLWDVRQGKVARAFLGGQKYASCLAFSVDGALLACQSSTEGVGRLMVWETATAKPILKREPIWTGYGLAFTPDGKSIVSVEGEKSPDIHLIEVSSGKTVRTLKGEGDHTAFSFSSDGKILAGAGQGRIVVWEPAIGRVVATLRYNSPNAAVFEPRGQRFLVGGGYDLVLLDAATGNKVWQAQPGGLINAIAFAPDGKQLALSTWAGPGLFRGWEPRLLILDSATGKKLREIAR